jgi:hypothetical protein
MRTNVRRERRGAGTAPTLYGLARLIRRIVGLTLAVNLGVGRGQLLTLVRMGDHPGRSGLSRASVAMVGAIPCGRPLEAPQKNRKDCVYTCC